MPYTLGIDLGTSAIKVALLLANGQTQATGTGEFPTVSELPGQAEQDPAAWDAALRRALFDLDAAVVGPHVQWREAVAAIGLTGQLPTLVCMGANGPVGRAITWKDARADGWASAAIDSTERAALYACTGMPIDGRYLGPMYAHHLAQGHGVIETLLSAKDYLVWRLTDVRITDPSTAAGYATYDLHQQAFSTTLAARWGMPYSALPPVAPSHARAGNVTDAAATFFGLPSGVPVSVGAADSVAAAYALTGLVEGAVSVTMGSSTIVLGTVSALDLDPHARCLVTPHVESGWYGREMDLLSTGTGHAWLSHLFGWQGSELDAAATTSVVGAHGLLFAPYLAGGEQGALWDPTLTGMLRGLTLRHGRADIARAYLEGTGFEMRRCLDVLEESAPVRHVVLSGGSAGTLATVQLLSDVLGVDVHVRPMVSAAAVGAALGARCIGGLSPLQHGMPAGQTKIVRPSVRTADYVRLCRDYFERATN